MRRLRGALGMGLVWGALGAGLGMLIELIDNIAPGALPFAHQVDMWPQVMAIIFFLGAAVFSALLWIAEGRRRFDELSLTRFAAWGVGAGALLGGYLVTKGAPGVFAVITPLGTGIAAAGSLVLARLAERRERHERHERPGKVAGVDAAALPPGDARLPSALERPTIRVPGS